ncbi:unnamed protein product [Caenorhabditis bovis]|uniref:Acyl_transf_3 domain-containing protein n=1 Tax=Caenorhabditis bovis TaxID=2654633 RepID=A0A8S1F0N7_9PELO|nr:unnamed protein product [Caenorhabditis bovis]
MAKEARMKQKRSDLQGIRGIAIISVLGFHFYPSIFPNGYLGVDQFFVLSGFLMCMLLKRSESDPIFTLILNFYTKRFRRILPLYYLIILFILILLYMIFPETAVENNLNSASNAILFISNRPKSDEEDYFQQLGIGGDLFTHTWSLSVEIQFYFIVPIIFILGTYLSSHLIYYAIIGSISFVYYTISDDSVSFNSVFARIWQFLIGMCVYLYTDRKPLAIPTEDESEELILKEDEEEISPKRAKSQNSAFYQYILLLTMTYLTTYPILIPADFTRLIVTVCTGLLMCVSEGNAVLSNRFLTYIGDFSYSLYLIHWPIFTFWKLQLDNDQSALLFCLLISILFAIASFEFFEKWYLKLTSTTIFAMVIILLFANVLLIHKNSIAEHSIQKGTIERNKTQFEDIPDNITLDEAAKINYMWTANDNRNLIVPNCNYRTGKPLGWCDYWGLNKTAKYKFFLFGNSWTANHGMLMYDECGQKAYAMVQGSAYGCEALYPTYNSSRCQRDLDGFKENIEKEKPDYAFIFTRFMSIGDPMIENSTKIDFSKDVIYKKMKENMKFYLKHIKKNLFILDAIPKINRGNIRYISKKMEEGAEPKEIDKMLVVEKGYELARKRYAQLFKDCGKKCVQIDYLPEFWDADTDGVRYFDEDNGLVYQTGVNHLSPHGLEKVRHIYTEICNQL